MANQLISIVPSGAFVGLNDTITAQVTGDPTTLVIYKNSSQIGFMTRGASVSGVTEYTYDLSGSSFAAGDTLTVAGATFPTAILHTYTVVPVVTNPAIVDLEIIRCLSDGTASDDGIYLRVTSFKITSDATASDLTNNSITLTGNANSITVNGITDTNTITITLDQTTLATALNGTYSESVPTLFANCTFSNASAFTGSATVGTAYEIATWAITVAKAFANLHLSGADTGGVAVGGFSSATSGNPKFECYFPAYFYGGIAEGAGGGDYVAAETEVGTWLGQKYYRQILTTTTTSTGFVTAGTIANLDAVLPMTCGVIETSANWIPITYGAGSTLATMRVVKSSGAVQAEFSGSGSRTYTIVTYYTKTA